MFIDNYVKARGHCDITEKYRSSAHGDCNINVELYQKISQPKKLWFTSYYARTKQIQP